MTAAEATAAVVPSLDAKWELRALAALALRMGALLLLYHQLERHLMAAGRLPMSSYASPVIFAEFIQHLALFKPFVLVSGVVVALCHRAMWRGWSELDHGIALRRFILVSAFVMAWSFSTYDYNLFFDRGHAVDRLLLIGLLPLIWWRPVFVLPFLAVLIPVIWQFDHPLGGYSWTDKSMVVRVLILFSAALVMLAMTRSRRTSDFAPTIRMDSTPN